VTSLVAVRRGHHDLAVGNVVGSNLFNLLLVLGTTAVIIPVPVPVHGHGRWDLIAMTVITILLWLMAVTHKFKVTRIEGIVLLTCYLGYMTWGVLRETVAVGQ
jgi:cation:H+ antiporter